MLRFKQFLIEQNATSYVDYSQPTPVKEFEEDYNSPEYFDSLNKKFVKLKTGERVELSPFDVMSLQFGKDKVKERDEYVEKLKDYHGKNYDLENYISIPRLSDEHLKEKIPFVTPSDFGVKDSKSTINKAVASHSPEASYFIRRSLPYTTDAHIDEIKKRTHQPEDIKTTSYISINPSEIKNYSDEELKDVLSHESWHRLAYPSQIQNLNNKNLKTPSLIAKNYNIDPTWSSTTKEMDRRAEEEKNKINQSADELIKNFNKKDDDGRFLPYEEYKSRQDEISKREDNLLNYKLRKSSLDTADISNEIKSSVSDEEDNKNYDSNSYYWNRHEVPAYMHELKMQLMRQNNQPYRMSDQSDESIENDANFLMDKLLDVNNPSKNFNPGSIKALQLLKTPEGKSIWRGVQKTSPKKDNRYA
jgi:hypothetical protein